MAVGFEMFQMAFQPVLDAYIAGEIDDEALKRDTEWEKRWFWPIVRYLPVFRYCKRAKIRMLAINADSEDLSFVEEGGLPRLGRERMSKYIRDPRAFAKFTNTTAFREYVAYVVSPSYNAHR